MQSFGTILCRIIKKLKLFWNKTVAILFRTSKVNPITQIQPNVTTLHCLPIDIRELIVSYVPYLDRNNLFLVDRSSAWIVGLALRLVPIQNPRNPDMGFNLDDPSPFPVRRLSVRMDRGALSLKNALKYMDTSAIELLRCHAPNGVPQRAAMAVWHILRSLVSQSGTLQQLHLSGSVPESIGIAMMTEGGDRLCVVSLGNEIPPTVVAAVCRRTNLLRLSLRPTVSQIQYCADVRCAPTATRMELNMCLYCRFQPSINDNVWRTIHGDPRIRELIIKPTSISNPVFSVVDRSESRARMDRCVEMVGPPWRDWDWCNAASTVTLCTEWLVSPSGCDWESIPVDPGFMVRYDQALNALPRPPTNRIIHIHVFVCVGVTSTVLAAYLNHWAASMLHQTTFHLRCTFHTTADTAACTTRIVIAQLNGTYNGRIRCDR